MTSSDGVDRANYSWNHDINTPAQEFDVIDAIQVAAATAKHMASEVPRDNDNQPLELTVEAYRLLRRRAEAAVEERARSNEPLPDDDSVANRRRELALFGAQASGIARQTSQTRLVVCFNCGDGPGVVASATVCLAMDGGNIEGAVMSIVGGQSVMAFLVSGHAARHPERLLANLHRALEGFGRPAISYRTVDTVGVQWPRPGSTYWHLTARYSGEESLLHTVCSAIAQPRKHRVPLVTISGWLERSDPDPNDPDREVNVQVVDLNFAIEPALDEENVQVRRSIIASIEHVLPKVQMTVFEVGFPTRAQPGRDTVAAQARDLLVTVAGIAEPGVVLAVIETLEDLMGASAVQGLSMALLEDISVVSVACRPGQAEVSEAQLVKAMKDRFVAGAFKEPDVRVQELDGPAAGPNGVARPTHEMSLDVREQPWVVAKLARVLRDNDANITWLASHVLKPLLDDQSLRCAVEMQFHVSQDSEVRLNEELRSLSAQEGWGRIALHPWAVSDAPRPTALERRLTELAPARLVQFSGTVGAEVKTLEAPSEYLVAVTLAGFDLALEGTDFDAVAPVEVTDGDSAIDVPFVLILEADDGHVDQPRREVRVREGTAGHEEFRVQMQVGTGELTLYVRQRNRTIQVLQLTEHLS
jgi:glycine cleavage system regulatory protein